MTARSDAPSLHLTRQFIFFLCARGAASIAYQMVGVAVGWQIYALTKRAFDLGLVGLVQFIPLVALILVAGHVADRYDRRRVIMCAQLFEAAALLVLLAATTGGWVAKESILLIVFAIGVARAFEFPTMQTMVPSLVEPAAIPRAMAVAASVSQAAIVAGPMLGGFLYLAGPAIVYGVAACLFLCSAAVFATLTLRARPRHREPLSLHSLLAGISFIRSRPVVLGAISLDLFAVLLGGATALLPIFARDILHAGPWALGCLRAAPAVGAFIASLILARAPLRRRVGRVMFTCVALFGGATIAFALSTWTWLSFVALLVAGAVDMVSVVIRGSLVQLETPDEMRGRVSAVNAVFIGTSNQLGEFESGLTAAWFGVVPAAVLGGVGTLVVVILWMKLYPELVHRERLENS
ncbi:MAG TPA: MFS transporter [Geobacteraceae bacterium]